MANKFINELNEIESVAVGDELPIWDSSGSDTRKTTVNKLASAITVNLVGEGISAPPSSNAVAIAVKNADAVLHVAALPTTPNIKNVIYHNTTNGKYYVGNKAAQTTSELNTDSVRYVQTLPVSPNIENLIYAVEALSGKYKFYAGDKDNQATQELGGSGAIFTGTQAEWDALTTAEKNEYSQANLTDVNSVVHVPVDTVADGNMNPVTSNAVYDALPTFEQYIIPVNYTIASGAVVEIETAIPWSNDIIVIPRWLGSTEVSLVNYFKSNNKVKITLRNNSSSVITISVLDAYLSVIRSKVSWS